MPDPIEQVTSWVHNGSTITVTTPCAGLSAQQCQSNHRELVEAMQADYPPDE